MNPHVSIRTEEVSAYPAPLLRHRHTRSEFSRPNPFSTPPLSTVPSGTSTQANTRPSSVEDLGAVSPKAVYSSASERARPAKYFQSRRTGRRAGGESRKVIKKKKEKWLWIIPTIGFVAGLMICALMVWTGIETPSGTYRLILDEDFSSGILDPSIWTFEIEVGGFGNGQFEETTDSSENAFIKNGQLHIQPTLQNVSLIENDSILNLTALGTCTSDLWSNCVTSTNTTNGTIVQPARSIRLNTKKGASIKYGRVEVNAKVSQGDWLWNAIWMLPTDSVYGPWPASGEIDITESRGNNYTYGPGGNDWASSTLHWGPDPGDDAYLKTFNTKPALHSQYGDNFHTYGLEWTPKALYTYVDTRLLQIYYIPFTETFWDRGQFPAASANGTLLVDPWISSPDINAPFNEFFYLILDVAVGGDNGYFPDGAGGKPWLNADVNGKTDFWKARDQWYPTWNKSSAMIIDSVKMWQLE